MYERWVRLGGKGRTYLRVCQMIMTRLKVEKRLSLVLCRVIHSRALGWEARTAMPSSVGARTVATSLRASVWLWAVFDVGW